MRVITGICRGKRLKSVKGLTTRPTADRVKEAVFNVLGVSVRSASFLDLFAGTGSIGIEALSRGAYLTVFVERDRRAIQVVKENLLSCQIEGKSQVYPLDALKALRLFNEKNLKFNLVYIDPPYKALFINEILEELVNLSLLQAKAVVVVETALDTELTEQIKVLKRIREDKYGDTKITYYQLDEEE